MLTYRSEVSYGSAMAMGSHRLRGSKLDDSGVKNMLSVGWWMLVPTLMAKVLL
jgi:hypothetical protein